jgi:hypothetical protein
MRAASLVANFWVDRQPERPAQPQAPFVRHSGVGPDAGRGRSRGRYCPGGRVFGNREIGPGNPIHCQGISQGGPGIVAVFEERPQAYAERAASLGTSRPDCTRQHHLKNCESPNSIHNVPLGDNGAAILDSLEYAVDLLRSQPIVYRRAILLISETLDRGSETTVEEAVHDITGTNTTIYSVGFSTAKSEAAHYAARQLPTQPSGRPAGLLSLEEHHPNPPHGWMGKDPRPDPDGPRNRWEQAYDCLGQLAPPLAFAKMAVIATIDGLQRNIPEAVTYLTGEYFKLTDSKSLERDLATIGNHLPNRYVLSFHPQSPRPGMHAFALSVPGYKGLEVTARTRYWADPPIPPPLSH